MRQELEAALTASDWLAIRRQAEDIQSTADPEELWALGSAYLYTGGMLEAIRCFRTAKPGLSGRRHAAALVDGATALALSCNYGEALLWLDEHSQLREAPFGGAAWECRAYCLWKMRAPLHQVHDAYQTAAALLGQQELRIARMTVDWVQMLVDYGDLDSAEELLRRIERHPDLVGKILSCRAHIAAARGDAAAARSYATEALQVLHYSPDKFGHMLREVHSVYMVLGRISSGPERRMWAEAAKAAAAVLRSPALQRAADKLGREMT